MDNQETVKRLRESRLFIAADLQELTQDVEATLQRLKALFVRTVLTSHFDDADQDNNAYALLTNLIGLAEFRAFVLKERIDDFGNHLHRLQYLVAGVVMREVAIETIKANAGDCSSGQLTWPPRVRKLVMDKLLYHLRLSDGAKEFLMQWETLCYILHLGLLGRGSLDKDVEKSIQEIVSGEHCTAVTFGRVLLPQLGMLTLGFPFLKKDESLGKWQPSGQGRDDLVRLIIAAMTYKVRLKHREDQFLAAMASLYVECPDLAEPR